MVVVVVVVVVAVVVVYALLSQFYLVGLLLVEIRGVCAQSYPFSEHGPSLQNPCAQELVACNSSPLGLAVPKGIPTAGSDAVRAH